MLLSGLAVLDPIAAVGALQDYHLFHAARADLLRRAGRPHEAAVAYRRALALSRNAVEQARSPLSCLAFFMGAPDPTP